MEFSLSMSAGLVAVLVILLALWALRPGADWSMSTHKMVRCALVAALYTALCLLLAPFSYGAVQVRVAEALCLLPIFGPEYIVGVTLGCFLSNLLGSGIIDVIFGTSATLLACLVTYRLRNFRFRGLALLPALPPVIFNALIVGPEIAIFFSDTPATLPLMVWNGFTVAVGEVISCMILGVLLVKVIESNPGLGRIFRPQH